MNIVTHDELGGFFDRLTDAIESIASKANQTGDGRQDYFTRAEASHYLRVSVRTLDTWTAAGEVKRAKLGNGPKAPVLYRKVDLDKFVEERLELDASDARKIARKQ